MQWNKAIVTGGAGFIGSHIVGELLKRGTEVISIDNYLSGSHDNLTEYTSNPLFKEVECDVLDREKLDGLMQGVEVIFHEAASKKTICMKDPQRDLLINAWGTHNLLDLARKHDVKKFVHASTGSVYGEGRIFPQTEEHSIRPTSDYGVSKFAGESYVNKYHDAYGLDTTVLRYFHVYGSKQAWSDTGGVVSIFIRKILNNEPIVIFGDGSQQRSFTYVEDDVNANMLVCDRKNTSGQIYNCASGINVTIKQLADTLARIMHKQPNIQYQPWVDGDIKVFSIDNSKIKRLGFEFKTSFDNGLRKTVQWMISAKFQGRF